MASFGPVDDSLKFDDNSQSYFEDIAERHLGKANGNVYHVRPANNGNENFPPNDGVLMVRLKKKRFIVLDYSLGAYSGKHKAEPQSQNRIPICITSDCPKVGIPSLTYDSGDPTESGVSLYLRSGLCFTCQRNLNEKRRTSKKRKSAGENELSSMKKKSHNSIEAMHLQQSINDFDPAIGDPSLDWESPHISVSTCVADYETLSVALSQLKDATKNVEKLINLSSLVNAPPPDEAIPIVLDKPPTTSDRYMLSAYHEKIMLALNRCVESLTEWKRKSLGVDENRTIKSISGAVGSSSTKIDGSTLPVNSEHRFLEI